ncbi:glycoside hydrolase family 28 protein [Enterococcus columbae]|uniref:Uncharacterized protein n=1 Tax=Enterococcus columbae DSM 7374 = ATCC 51263 TaxID=1121865 RepID=S0KI41_9ENTE|nr:glycosyl hydrolase family 28 protein [Enterococcus columbae]EOT44347.1 hypothetical protein OMW_00403 [Enterococcus columbae DSM 7374 = ATCC 51263]EOW84505.1 hypothetical protein I568_01001 [Enterococcus columbae DSM 7374 = ATCC 51263]OJG21017.1 hypothetical protein RR47_GL001486 [Enterococcus columbae DSM 7374 = ATCC 51263]
MRYKNIEGLSNTTIMLQENINLAKRLDRKLIIPAGKYIVGSLFLPTNFKLELLPGAEIIGSNDITDYKLIETKIAGVHINWPAAIINIINAENVEISGGGKINGQGVYWWKKFWGNDQNAGMLSEYTQRNLRWAVDYLCYRPRNIYVANSKNIQLHHFESIDSGFWNIHLYQCKNVNVSSLVIKNGEGPSTDGIDIDSCEKIKINNCDIKGNDDNIAVKSGRDFLSYKNKVTSRKIKIENCIFREGSGVCFGSETAGGIEDIVIQNCEFYDTGAAIRVKAFSNRGGYIKNIMVNNISLENVKYCFLFQADWYPKYSKISNIYNLTDEEKSILKYLIEKNDIPRNLVDIENIHISNFKADYNEFCHFRTRAFFIEGAINNPINRIKFENIKIKADEFGKISGVNSLIFDNVDLSIKEQTSSNNDIYTK